MWICFVSALPSLKYIAKVGTDVQYVLSSVFGLPHTKLCAPARGSSTLSYERSCTTLEHVPELASSVHERADADGRQWCLAVPQHSRRRWSVDGPGRWRWMARTTPVSAKDGDAGRPWARRHLWRRWMTGHASGSHERTAALAHRVARCNAPAGTLRRCRLTAASVRFLPRRQRWLALVGLRTGGGHRKNRKRRWLG